MLLYGAGMHEKWSFISDAKLSRAVKDMKLPTTYVVHVYDTGLWYTITDAGKVFNLTDLIIKINGKEGAF